MGLSLIFNKEYRKEEKLMNTLATKIIGAKYIENRHKDNTEIYDLYGLEIHFNVISHELKVLDGKGETVYTMNCEFDADNEFQKHRSMWFSDLLEIARKQLKKQQEKAAHKLELEKGAAKIHSDKEKKKTEEQARLLQIQNAIDRIK